MTTSHCKAAFSPGIELKDFEYTTRELKDDDVLINITHCGVCHSDVHSTKNDWKSSKYPLVPGHEIIGVISKKGSKVNLGIGQRVGVGPNIGGCDKCSDCKNGEPNMCGRAIGVYNTKDKYGQLTYGGFATAIVVDHRYAYPIPDNLPSEHVAPLLCAGITVYAPLKRWCKPGQTVGILGIGGLGHMAIQFSKALRCKTVAISSTPDKEQEARGLGADDFVCSKERAQMDKYKKSLDFILVTVNVNLPWAHYLSLLRTDGRLCFVGLPDGELKLNPHQLVLRRLSVVGSNVGSPQEVREMLEVASKNGIEAVTEEFEMADVNTAMKRVNEGSVRYRAVLRNPVSKL